MKIDGILESVSSVLAFESSLHAVRLLVELGLASTETPTRDVVAFEAFAVAMAWRVAQTFGADDAVVCLLPWVALAYQCTLTHVYEYVAIALAVGTLSQPCGVHPAWLVVVFSYLQLYTYSARSNALRTFSLIAMFFASFAGSLEYAQYLVALSLELASWATERTMLPWRLDEGRACCTATMRFLLGFVVGIYILDGSAEGDVRVRPEGGRLPTVRGISFVRGKAFLRYRASPLGVALAYIEGLQVIPVRLVGSERSPDVYHVHVVGAWHLFDVDTRDWACCAPSEPLVAASRFPFRRLLLGLLLRLV